jgi:hypothetical protein
MHGVTLLLGTRFCGKGLSLPPPLDRVWRSCFLSSMPRTWVPGETSNLTCPHSLIIHSGNVFGSLLRASSVLSSGANTKMSTAGL